MITTSIHYASKLEVIAFPMPTSLDNFFIIRLTDEANNLVDIHFKQAELEDFVDKLSQKAEAAVTNQPEKPRRY